MKKYQKCYAIDQGRCQEIFSGGVELWVTGEQKKRIRGEKILHNIRPFLLYLLIFWLFLKKFRLLGGAGKNSRILDPFR